MVAHLVVPLEVGIPAFLVAMLASRGDFDRANLRLTRGQARRPFGELLEVLRRKADSRFTPPGAGPEAPLTDVLVHGLDIRRPLGLPREIPERRLRTSLTYLTGTPRARIVGTGTFDGLRLEADDIGWSWAAARPCAVPPRRCCWAWPAARPPWTTSSATASRRCGAD